MIGVTILSHKSFFYTFHIFCVLGLPVKRYVLAMQTGNCVVVVSCRDFPDEGEANGTGTLLHLNRNFSSLWELPRRHRVKTNCLNVLLSLMQLLWILWAVFVLETAAASDEDRGNRFWSGQPQAIGIDLSPSYMSVHAPTWIVYSGDP